jgi:Arm DNA-binding domain
MAEKTRKAQALTDTAIKAMKPDALAYRVPDMRCKGLALRVATDGGKTWDLSYRIKGKGIRRPSLGRYEDVKLEAARRRANELTSAARQGRDLIAEEDTAKNEYDLSFTVETLVGEYAKRRLKGLKTASAIERRIRRTVAQVMTRKATDIRRRELRQILDEVADQGFKGEAEKRRSTIQPMFRWG